MWWRILFGSSCFRSCTNTWFTCRRFPDRTRRICSKSIPAAKINGLTRTTSLYNVDHARYEIFHRSRHGFRSCLTTCRRMRPLLSFVNLASLRLDASVKRCALIIAAVIHKRHPQSVKILAKTLPILSLPAARHAPLLPLPKINPSTSASCSTQRYVTTPSSSRRRLKYAFAAIFGTRRQPKLL